MGRDTSTQPSTGPLSTRKTRGDPNDVAGLSTYEGAASSGLSKISTSALACPTNEDPAGRDSVVRIVVVVVDGS